MPRRPAGSSDGTWTGISLNTSGKLILFDTGQGSALPENAERLGIELCRTDSVVLSHGHFDHTGGLALLFALGIAPKIFMHPNAVRARYGCLQEPPHKPIGMRADIASMLAAGEEHIISTNEPTQLADNIWVTASVPRLTPYEDVGGRFFVDPECTIPDLITDDQAMWIPWVFLFQRKRYNGRQNNDTHQQQTKRTHVSFAVV